MINVGIIGYGYWGPNLVRNFAEVKGARVAAVSDLDGNRLSKAKLSYPAIETSADHRELLADAAIDAIVVATPVSTHFELARDALAAGKHVLVEKPISTTSDEARRLIEEADSAQKVLMVDHTFLYTGAVRKIRQLIDDGKVGRLLHYDSVRINLGLFQHDVNVLWDLAVHDLSIMDYLLDRLPVAVSADAVANVAGQPENTAYLTCFFDDDTMAHIHVNWLSPVKIRRTIISGDRQMVVYDDLEPSDKVKVYDSGITLSDDPEMLVGYRTGDVWIPKLDRTEALFAEAQHFVDCVSGNAAPTTGGETALRVVRLLEAASESAKSNGKRVEV